LECLEDIDGHYVDLHCGFTRIGQTKAQDGGGQDIRRLHRFRRFRINRDDMLAWDELFSRSQLAPLGRCLSEPGAVATGSPEQSKVQRPMSQARSEPGAVATGSPEQSKVQRPMSQARSEPGVATGSPEQSKVQRPMSQARSEPGAVATGSPEQSRVQRPMSPVRSEAGARSEPGAVATGSVFSSAEQVRILCDEDHLRLLSFHLLRSGVRRPPWLCDVALLLESRAKDFDWELCLGQTAKRDGDWRNLNWLATTVGLAHHLLGADPDAIENTPLADHVNNLPRWLVPAVLRQWGGRRLQSRTRVRSAGRLTLDVGLWTSLVDLYARWDNPVRATAAVGGQFNNWPRLPYRVAELCLRLPEVPMQLSLLTGQARRFEAGAPPRPGRHRRAASPFLQNELKP
jgi:hypothetical protein